MNTLSILKHLFGSEAKASHSDINMNDVDPDAWVNSPYGQSEMDEDKGMEISKKNYADHFKTTGMKKNKKINEGRGVMNYIKDAVEDLMIDGDISAREAAMELVIAIADEYDFDLAGLEIDLFDKGMSESRYTKIRDYYKKIDQLKQSSQKEYEKRKEAEKSKKQETANPQDGKSAPYGSGYKPVKELTKEQIEVLLEKCWDGYQKKGMKTMFGKRVPNCVKKEDFQNLVVGLINEAQGKEVLMEKDDRCTRIAKRKYDTWPSAYASGAVVRCRRGDIWKNEK